MNKEDKILGLIGFSSRTRSFVFGKDGIRSYIKSLQNKKVVIIASDTGKSTKDDTIKRCESFNVPCVVLKTKTKEDLSNALGKTEVSIVGIEDENIVKGILDLVGGDA
ncbi:hypothetical protein OSSY52_04070 [Tepiditoga spiralis]|uniref:Ribosomal protein eL8/eL30/eS12/Gadd45 domain-containing protein n=1 Tax=Tepiditoga spiralis TaxID=2108365 RepID=A0A7G1G4V5_9BACT|nr:ribosomal L7Ae/L30e/S12e/Gadd45 family protein [Tepiditoga spiralis]BBE30266.1 hypothetical protein OSSY52_04070 [Tepiditoga spiralis]